MAKPKGSGIAINPALVEAINDMLASVKTLQFEDKEKAINLAIKFETLRLRSKGDDTGKFFNQGGDDDGDDF